MNISIKENGIHMDFIVTEEKRLQLIGCSIWDNCNLEENKFAQAVEIQCAGENQNDHHGAKHCYCASSDSLEYISHEITSNSYGKLLKIELTDDKMRVILNYQFYDGIQAFRSWTDVENISDEKIGLQYISSFAFTGIDKKDKEQFVYIPSNAWVREALWKKYSLSELGLNHIDKFSTKRVGASNSGTWSTKEFLPMGCYDNGTEAYLWQIENNGSWNWEISDINDRMYLKLSGPSENENHWYKELDKGEAFSSVKTAIAISDNFTDALSQMTSYRRKIVRKNNADCRLPVIFNDYMHCLWANPTTERMLPVIDKAAEVGAEYYCMDAGWYDDGEWWDKVGEWRECKSRFPKGLKEVFDYVRSKGMIPGIWLEIQVVGTASPIAKQFDDNCFFVKHGKRVIDHGRYQFDFRNKKVQEYATSIIDRMVNDYGVGYIKIDYNIDGGIGTEINSDSFGDGLLEHNRAYVSWLEKVMDKYPDLILENCSSGGMCMDYALLSKHPIQSISDQEDYNYTSVISAAAPTAVLPEQGAIWSYPLEASNIGEVVTNMVSPMLMRMHLGGEIHKLSEEQFNLVKDGVNCYKSVRENIKEAKVFYPIGLPKVNDEWIAVGFECEKRNFIKIWRRNSKSDSLKIQLPKNYNSANILFSVKGGCKIKLSDDIAEISLKDKISAALIELCV